MTKQNTDTTASAQPENVRKGQLKLDGRIVMEGTEGEAMAWIHRNHSFSYTHALRYEGFSYDTAEEIKIREAMKQ